MGKTVKIYLDDGTVSGIRHAEISNWDGQAISSPRSKIKALASEKFIGKSHKPGVYFLFGIDEESGEDAVYIGEAENVFNRLKNHLAKKDFWNEVVFFTSKDENLTKVHVKYLESRLIQLAKKTERHVVLNRNEPQLPVLPLGDRDAMDEFAANLKILLGTVGYKTLESIEQRKTKIITEQDSQTPESTNTDILESTNTDILELYLNVKGINAQAHLIDEGIVVLAGSHVSQDVKDSLSDGYKKRRELFIQNGTLKETNNGYVFTKNQLFKSPSQAAGIVVGYSINGRHNWQTKNGTTLKSIEESSEPLESIIVEGEKKGTQVGAIYTIDEHFKGKSKDIQELMHVVCEFITGLDSTIEEVPKKCYIAYKASQNIVCMESKNKNIKLFVKLKSSEIIEPPKSFRDVSEIGHVGTGDAEFTISTQEEFEETKKYIELSYNKFGG